MNREAGNIREIAPGVTRPPRREDYEPLVRAMRPFLEDEEAQLRASLLLMRDRAMATKASSRTCDPAWRVLDVVERIGTEHAMNWRVPVDALREMRRNCLNLICAASNFDVLWREHADDPPEAA